MRNNQELIHKTKEQAKEYFTTGMNCSECVFQAVYDAGLSEFPPEVVALATAFGGGLGLSGNNCGALTGAMLAISSIHGRKNPHEKETAKERALQLAGPEGRYRLFNHIPNEFKKKFGEVNCSKLVAPYEWGSKERRGLCQNLVAEAAAMAVYWSLEGIDKGYSQPFGENVAGIEN